MPTDKLTYRESLFVGSYVVCGGNATKALRNLGFGGKNPDVSAARYMARPRVQRAIQSELTAHGKAVEATIERIAAEYSTLAFGQHEGPLLAGHKLSALEALGKWRGMFRPEAVAVVPVTFSIINAPPIPGDGEGSVTITARTGDASSASLVTTMDVEKATPRGR